MCANFQAKQTTLISLAQICPKVDFQFSVDFRSFQNLNPDLESTPPVYHVCQFVVKLDNFELLGLYLMEIPQLRTIFWF